MTSRIFELPLFDAGAPSSFRLFFNQSLAEEAEVTAFFSDGFPDTYQEFGVQLDRLVWGPGEVDLAVGDFLYSALRPDDVAVLRRDMYRLRGGRFNYRVGATSLRLFAGEPRFFRQLPDRSVDTPGFAGFDVQRRVGLWSLGGGLNYLRDATLLFEAEPEDMAVFALRAHRSFWSDGTLFADLELTDDGAPGGRAGAQIRGPVGVVTGFLYSYDDRFPWLYPVYRLGEKGIDVSATYHASSSLTTFGRLTYLDDSVVDPHDEIQGYVGASWFLGDNRPSVLVEYSRNDLATDLASIAPRDRTSDRFVVGLNGSTNTGYVSARLEQVWESGTGARDRSQLTAFWRRGLRFERFVDVSAVVQREQNGDLGATVDGFVERPIRGRWSVIAGLGVAYQHFETSDRGEGLLRLGVARRMTGNGLALRAEALVPFSIGLERANLRRNQVSVNLSYILDWRRTSDIRAAWAPLLAPHSFGSLEGRVTLDGEPASGVPVLIGGSFGATTGSDGFFKVRRVPIGPVTVGVDLSRFSPRIGVAGEVSQTVDVRPSGAVPIEILLEETSLLQGAVVRCGSEGAIDPVPGAEFHLTRNGDGYDATTSALGAFHFDRLSPGRYELILDPSSIDPPLGPRDQTRWTIDLTETDVTGFVIRINCESGG